MTISDRIMQSLRPACSHLPLACGQEFPSPEQKVVAVCIIASAVIVAVSSFFGWVGVMLSAFPVGFIVFATAACILDLRDTRSRLNRLDQVAAERQRQREADEVVMENLRIATENVEKSLQQFHAKFGAKLQGLGTAAHNRQIELANLVAEKMRLEQELSNMGNFQSAYLENS